VRGGAQAQQSRQVHPICRVLTCIAHNTLNSIVCLVGQLGPDSSARKTERFRRGGTTLAAGHERDDGLAFQGE
jgi:hypothetical protein